nr:hypothetical protein [Blautia pseudococcoides]
MQKAKEAGSRAYGEEQAEKAEIFRYLLGQPLPQSCSGKQPGHMG